MELRVCAYVKLNIRISVNLDNFPFLMNYVERALDGTTMYKVVIYALLAIAFAALTLSIAGVLFFTPLALILSFIALVVGSLSAHYVAVTVTKAPGNVESSLITALILFLVLTPETAPLQLALLAFLGGAAVTLKYLVRWRLRHIFNPVALVMFLAGLFGYFGAEWWVGSRYLLPVVLIAGLVVVTKTRRWPLFLTYVGLSATFALIAFWNAGPLTDTLIRHFISWPTIFFAAFMLTEPLGLPSTKRLQYVYAGIAALLSSVPFTIGPIYGTPELALLAANLMTFVVDRPERLRLTLSKKHVVGTRTVEYIFTAPRPITFMPGQYLEWTLPHGTPDTRGIRRYFTVASAPGGHEVSFAVRHVDRQSTWKQTLEALPIGGVIYAAQRAGDFTLRPSAPHHVWIAGGIGVTPFMSMIRHAAASQQRLPVTFFYCNKTESDIAFLDEVTSAAALGLETVHVLAEPASSGLEHETGYITEAMLTRHVHEYRTATYYISGPPGLVKSYHDLLRKLGVPEVQIVTDYFPGLA